MKTEEPKCDHDFKRVEEPILTDNLKSDRKYQFYFIKNVCKKCGYERIVHMEKRI